MCALYSREGCPSGGFLKNTPITGSLAQMKICKSYVQNRNSRVSLQETL